MRVTVHVAARAFSALPAVAIATFAWSANADTGQWIAVEGTCRASAAELERRVDAGIGATRADRVRGDGLRARVRVEEREIGVHLTVDVERDGRPLGTKILTAPQCDEAVDAAVVVLTLALTAPAPAATTPSAPAAPSGPAAASLRPKPAAEAATSEPPHTEASPPPDVSRDPGARDTRTSAQPSTRVALLGGIDAGTLPGVTPYVGAAVTVPISVVELRAAVRYGLRREDESVDGAISDRTRRDFGAVELGLCRGTGSALRFSLCAGGEVDAVRVERERTEGDLTVDTDTVAPRVAGVLGGWIAHAVGPIQPELEIAGSAVALGPRGAPRTGFRVGGGLAARF